MESKEAYRATIVQRLDGYLERDKTGIRHAVITMLLSERSVTAFYLHSKLDEEYGVSPKQVISMLGVMTSKLGIIAAKRESYDKVYTYTLRDKYVPLVVKALEKFRGYAQPLKVVA